MVILVHLLFACVDYIHSIHSAGCDISVKPITLHRLSLFTALACHIFKTAVKIWSPLTLGEDTHDD